MIDTVLHLHSSVRHQLAVRADVADALRRHQAAIELEQARQAVREAGRGVTQTQLYRQACAEAVWDACTITAWQVTSC